MPVASASPLPAALSAFPPAAAPSPAPGFLPLRARRAGAGAPRLGTVATWRRRRLRAEAIKTEREKQQTEVPVEDSFPVRKAAAPPDGADDPTVVPSDEGWAVKLEQSVNIFLTDSVIMLLDLFYPDPNYARFFVLETIARVPYFGEDSALYACNGLKVPYELCSVTFCPIILVPVLKSAWLSTAFISVLHLYETFRWWRKADYIKVHFAQSWNEFHHLLIMEVRLHLSFPATFASYQELGGNAVWTDRFLARFMAFFYYFITVGIYMLSPRMAYHFSECVERHAYSTYDKFLKLHEEELKRLPAPEAALNYYLNEDLYLFDEFQTARVPCSRRPIIGESATLDIELTLLFLGHRSLSAHCFPYSIADNLYDVFVNIRDDEAEHCKTMKACQTHGNLRSPHSTPNCLEADRECVIPENDCEGIVDCVKKSLTK
ncbi:hypothetical protein HU200_006710 [Digitaria exilis]|uniref:Ubiquinol oxidase n=1 Tax=Digitaria exilis TaxID=1010633 RepID=A0A835KV73_9POAL|nr:hypothetical protein HU200_006710 [Digitaria exilis]